MRRKLALYRDETTPGNQKHLDNSRQLQAIYFTLLIFPHWYRRRPHGWWMFGCLRTDIQHELISDLSGLMKEVLYVFFSPTSFNLAVGMRLPLSDGSFNISIKNGPNIQDLKAHQAMTDSKGTSGTHCCINCKAVLHIDPARIRNSSYWRHYALVTPNQ